MNQRDGKYESKHLEQWRARMASWQVSGLTQAASCRKHGLTESRFRYWKRRIKESGNAPPLLEKVPKMLSTPPSSCFRACVPRFGEPSAQIPLCVDIRTVAI